jgi:hypothetical protein
MVRAGAEIALSRTFAQVPTSTPQWPSAREVT